MFCYCCQSFTNQVRWRASFFKSVNINHYPKKAHINLHSLVSLLLIVSVYTVWRPVLLQWVHWIKRHSVCLFLSFAASSRVLTTQRHSIDILSKSTLHLSLPLWLCLQLSISVFLHQPPISASNIFNPHCWYSSRLLFLDATSSRLQNLQKSTLPVSVHLLSLCAATYQ